MRRRIVDGPVRSLLVLVFGQALSAKNPSNNIEKSILRSNHSLTLI
jgi:hypothetical protein